MSMNYETIKRLAKERKCRVTDLIALAVQNDPFYAGTSSQWRDAEWFAKIWEEAGYGNGGRVHLRRIHYRVVSLGTVVKPDGDPYQNTEKDWEYLQSASRYARFLGLVDARCFEDRRNPDPIIGSYDERSTERVWNPEIELSETSWDLPEEIYVDLDDLSDATEAPAPVVRGYDYWEQRQPYQVELWCEKSTMNDVLEPIAHRYGCNIQTGLGFQSISSVLALIGRGGASDKKVRVLYISDYDPAGADMPKAVARQLEFWRLKYAPDLDIALKPIVLTREQVETYDLPRIPIKESDRRKEGFEKREGKGAVELDALEALYPGELRRIIEAEVERLRDPRLSTRYWDAHQEAKETVEFEWELATADLRDDIEAIGDELTEIRDRYKKRIQAIQEDYKADTEALSDRLENLRQAIRERAEDFSPDLPDLPEPEIEGDDPDEWLYHSGRDYEEQLRFYNRAKNGDEIEE